MAVFPANHFNVIRDDLRSAGRGITGNDDVAFPALSAFRISLTSTLIALTPHTFSELARPAPHFFAP